jgi:NAD(P)H-hydrate epimerase
MKVLPIDKVREADAYTIKNEPIDSIDLMERAAKSCFKWMQKKLSPGAIVKVFCGLGNNGGDGLALARLLAKKEFRVEVFIVRYSDKASEDFTINLERLEYQGIVRINEIRVGDELPSGLKGEWVVDAIFGSGLSKPVSGFIADVIDHINQSGARVISVDVPSGLFCDKSSVDSGGAIIHAEYTLTFQFPKKAFMFAENLIYVKEWEPMPIGLHPDFIKSAAVLASEACMRAGAGLLTTHIPQRGYGILQTAVPEAMSSIDRSETAFTEIPNLDPYNAIGIGPGIGQDKETQTALKVLIQNTGLPILFDADAINILGENKTWISFIPPGSIFTPHPKEFERLVGKSSNAFERDKLQREFSIKYGVYVVLKGYSTAISCPDGTCYYNSTGNPGMATGGSGDALTGMILGLLAQGYNSLDACLVGAHLHGLAGDLASEELGYEASLASDIIGHIGYAYQYLQK